MERLTEWDEFDNADIIALGDMMPEIYAKLSFSEANALTEALNRFAKYEDAMSLERAQELAQAEKDGRLVVLPFKMGDMVWADTAIVGDRYKSADRPYSVEVVFIGMGKENGFFHVQYSNGRIFPFDFDKVGKVVFLTREEAEAALKKREAENEAD